MVELQIGQTKYQWLEHWAQFADTVAPRGWAHPGIAVTAANEIATCHADRAEILVFAANGELKQRWASGLTEIHGIAAVHEPSGDFLWLMDNGVKADPDRNYDEPPSETGGRVVKMSVDGRPQTTLPKPPIEAYFSGDYAPTSAAVFEEARGGNGDVWVADGYGQSHVHRFDRAGNYKSSLNGEEGAAGRFDTPHGIFIKYGQEPELYISDRRNDRIQVYDLDGNFKRAFGQDFLNRPGGFALLGEQLVIAELMARATVVDENDTFVTYVGANTEIIDQPGWPNQLAADGTQVAPKFTEGKFNSPHAITSDSDGNIYVTEWVIGGRIIKLAKV